ncbi:MAG: polymer-forming cytoskeletal protein [Alphaproteobacteria bacterium]|nr:polymer-forming cytoskeletal protein [Alphaproteobacteria bacterium]
MNRPLDPRSESNASNASSSSGASSGTQARAPLRATPPTPTARRVVDMPTTPNMRRPTTSDGPRFGTTPSEGRRMVVAKDITLAGQISKCDYLIVEGGVEGMRYDGQALEVAEGGSFNGSIEVDSAEIAGTFEGVVVVRGRLTIRPTGRITGTIRYGEIEINAGGQVNGELQGMQATARPSISSSFGNSSSDDEDTDSSTDISSERLAGE